MFREAPENRRSHIHAPDHRLVADGPALSRESSPVRGSLHSRGRHPSTAVTSPALRLQDPSNNCSKKRKTNDAVARALARARSWRVPPHWSKCDWFDELGAIINSGAACAGRDFDSRRSVPLEAHIYTRSLAAARTRYRQEWSYYLHASTEFSGTPEPVPRPSSPSTESPSTDSEAINLLEGALSQLTLEDQCLIRHLFWNESGQDRVASVLRISQQCVSKRKTRVLRQLRRLLAGKSPMLSHVLTVCWAVLDSLDLLPVIDFL